MIEFQNVTKDYIVGGQVLHVLKGVDFQIKEGEMVAVMGASGSGKSTMMNIVGLLDSATSGLYLLNGKDVTHLKEKELAHIRNRHIGFVFQSFFLLPRLNCLQNVSLPLFYRGEHGKAVEERAMALLEKVGMHEHATHRPNQLSGGQQQRVAIARALIGEPTIILADEPTGSLDTKTSREVMDIFHELNKEGVTLAIITHDPDVGEECQRLIRVSDGLIIEDTH